MDDARLVGCNRQALVTIPPLKKPFGGRVMRGEQWLRASYAPWSVAMHEGGRPPTEIVPSAGAGVRRPCAVNADRAATC